MSRKILSNHIEYSTEAVEEKKTCDGKLLFTEYKGKKCGILVKGNRILAMEAISYKPNRIGAVYLAKVKNVSKEIHAAFVEIADGEICFLPEKDFPYGLKLKQGDEIPVQLIKEAHKTKQASVTANISFANEAAVVSLNNKDPKIGYSSKLSSAGKETLKEYVEEWYNHYSAAGESSKLLNNSLPAIVIRTQAEHLEKDVFIRKLSEIVDKFVALINSANYRTCFSCLKEAKPAFATILEEMADFDEYQEIVTEDVSLYRELQTYCNKHHPDQKIRLYSDNLIPLNKLYAISSKAECAFNAQIWLKSGAYLVIEPTEALTVIDVNSGKYEGKRHIDNILAINMEAAKEIALQLRLRNLSGIIIIDFISMKDKSAQQQLLQNLKELVKYDHQQTTIVDITPLGLVEITRKRNKASLREQFR